MKYPMTEDANQKFREFLEYAEADGEFSLGHAIQSFICDGEMDLDKRRKRALYIASLGGGMSSYAFYSLEEASRGYENGQTDRMFEYKRMKELNKQLNELTSKGSYDFMTNQSAMRKLFTALMDFMDKAIFHVDTKGKTREEYRQEIRTLQAEFDELMVEFMLTDREDPKSEEINNKLSTMHEQIGDMEGAWRRMKRT